MIKMWLFFLWLISPHGAELEPLTAAGTTADRLYIFVNNSNLEGWSACNLILSGPNGQVFDFTPTSSKSASHYAVQGVAAGRYTFSCLRRVDMDHQTTGPPPSTAKVMIGMV